MAHIGLDLDNTIIDYDAAFLQVGESIGLISSSHRFTGKLAVKAYLLAREAGAAQWMRLQGQVYGPHIGVAVPFAGAADFINDMLKNGHRITIISHKTRFGHFDESGTCLWDAARSWLHDNGIVTDAPGGLCDEDVMFAESRAAKIAAIRQSGCDLFVDDLLEVLLHTDFPEAVERIWFTGRGHDLPTGPLRPFGNWQDISVAVDRYLGQGRSA